jgi:hypothetical protein
MPDQQVVPEIGSDVRARVQEALGSSLWQVECPGLPHGWTALLKSKEPITAPQTTPAAYWVFAVDAKRQLVFLTNSDFGTLPISDRMRPRYLKAMEDVLQFLSDANHVPSAESLSEVKGILNRCRRKDQWDWLSVYKALGNPPYESLEQGVRLTSELRDAVQSRNKDQMSELSAQALALGLNAYLAQGTAAITEQSPRLPHAKMLKSPSRPGPNENGSRAPEAIISEVSKAKLDHTNEVHQSTLEILRSLLVAHGYQVERSEYIDAYCRLKSGPAIFEIKSITVENELTQCRHALSQLYEYRFRHGVPDASLWLVLSEKPHTDWLVRYLREDRDINVLWLEGDILTGSDVDLLLESGSAALKRRVVS